MLIMQDAAQNRYSTKLSNEIKREVAIQEARQRQTAAIMNLAAARLRKQKSYAKALDLMEEAATAALEAKINTWYDAVIS